MGKLTQKIQINNPLTEEEKDGLLKEIVDARRVIARKNEELKEFRDAVKDAIEAQETILDMACGRYNQGYTPELVECSVVYDKGVASFYDVKNGEKVDERPITDEEQLRLNENRVDVEDIIRADSDNS